MSPEGFFGDATPDDSLRGLRYAGIADAVLF